MESPILYLPIWLVYLFFKTRSHSVALSGLELSDLPVSNYPVLGLKVYYLELTIYLRLAMNDLPLPTN